MGNIPPGDIHDPEALVREHAGLVKKLARAYERRHRREMADAGLEFEDLVQEGLLALLQAGRTYRVTEINPETGRPYAWSTWASWAIDGAIRNYVRDHNSLVRVPAWAYAEGKRAGTYSLDEKARVGGHGWGAQEEETYLDRLEDPDPTPEATVLAREEGERRAAQDVALVRWLFAATGGVTERERDLALRLAGLVPLADGATPNLSSVGKDMGISRERARQLRNAFAPKLLRYLAGQSADDRGATAAAVLESALARTMRAGSHKTTKPASAAPVPAKRNGARKTGVSSTSNSSEFPRPSRSDSRRTGTPRRASDGSTRAA